MTTQVHTPADERGISLLVVLLVGTIMLFTSLAVGQYALRMVSSIRARSEATQTLYTAEQAFECVKYWLNKDYRHFSTEFGGPEGGVEPVCNGVNYNFTAGTDGADDGNTPVYTHATGIGEFRIPFDSTDVNRGGVIVQVERTDPSAHMFDGKVRVYSQSDSESGSNTSERFQEYKYRVLYGADIMFVVDRSGSIEDGGNRGDRVTKNEWNEMLDAVIDSIRLLDQKVPSPFMGIVSFGSDADDTGVLADDCTGVGCNWRQPDQKLTDTLTNLIIEDGGNEYPNMNREMASTNLSLGMSIAGAELMGKYYPHTGIDEPPLIGFGPGKFSGEFERIVATDMTDGFDLLPDQDDYQDRDDNQYQDVMVIITDGEPNVIMTHRNLPSFRWFQSAVGGPPNWDFLYPVSYVYRVGEPKLFRTSTGGKGAMVIDDSTGLGIPTCHDYKFCNDIVTVDDSNRPSGILSAPNNTDDYPQMAMCNATLIANKLKADENITIIGIYVGADENSDTARWMKNDLVSSVGVNEPLFARVAEYDEIQEALLFLFESLDLVQSR